MKSMGTETWYTVLCVPHVKTKTLNKEVVNNTPMQNHLHTNSFANIYNLFIWQTQLTQQYKKMLIFYEYFNSHENGILGVLVDYYVKQKLTYREPTKSGLT